MGVWASEKALKPRYCFKCQVQCFAVSFWISLIGLEWGELGETCFVCDCFPSFIAVSVFNCFLLIISSHISGSSCCVISDLVVWYPLWFCCHARRVKWVEATLWDVGGWFPGSMSQLYAWQWQLLRYSSHHSMLGLCPAPWVLLLGREFYLSGRTVWDFKEHCCFTFLLTLLGDPGCFLQHLTLFLTAFLSHELE